MNWPVIPRYQDSQSKFYSRIILDLSLQLGESYMDSGYKTFYLIGFAELQDDQSWWNRCRKFLIWLLSVGLNFQSYERYKEVGEKHYDLGNELFELMLDSRMIYSCGYWRIAETLKQAQYDKLDLIARNCNC